MKKIVFEGKKFSIIHETIRRGKSIKIIEYCQRPLSVIVLVVSKDDKILFLRENRIERGGYSWGLVAGHVEKNEENNPIAAAKRELREEANLIAKKIKLLFVSEPSSSIKGKRYVYIVKDYKQSDSEGKKDYDENIEIHYFSFQQALKMVLDGKVKNETSCIAIIRYLSVKKRLFLNKR